MPIDLPALAVDAAEKRRKLLIAFVVQRMLEIQLVERLDDVMRQPSGKDRGQTQHQQQEQHDGLEHSHDEHAHRRAADGDTQHRAVRQAACAVHGLFQKRVGITYALARAVLQSVLNFLAVGVIGKRGGISLGIV